MYSGQSFRNVFDTIQKERRSQDRKMVAVVYADYNKQSTVDLLDSFFSDLHFVSGDYLSFYMIGYRSRESVDEYAKSHLKKVASSFKLGLNVDSNDLPNFFDSNVYIKENNINLERYKWKSQLGDSRMYMIFFDVYDGNINLDNSLVVNFDKKDQKRNFEFMELFISELRKSSGEDLSIEFVEKVMSIDMIRKLGRGFKVGLDYGTRIASLIEILV